MDDWKTRYWGLNNYEKLLSIKKKYDPTNIFYCYHCVGSDEGSNAHEGNFLVGIIAASVGASIILIGVVIFLVVNNKKRARLS